MSYAEAKEIALLRLELRAACHAGNRCAAAAALVQLARLAQAGNDNELAAEIRRWTIKLEASGAT